MATLHAQLSFLTHQQHNTKQNYDQYSDHQQLLSLIDRCYDLKQVKRIHAHLLRVGHLFFDPYLAGRLVAFCSFSPFSSLDYARKVFDQIPQPNLITWNTLIRAYASSRTPDHSLLIFSQMLHQCPDPPNKYTYPFAIKAASELSALREGRVFHGTVIKASLGSDIFILNSLIHFYASCGQLDEALKVFLKIPNRDVVSWNSMITAYSQSDYPEKALELFRGMEMDKVKPNDVTMVGVLSACAKNLNLEFGRWVHSYIERNEIDMDLILSNVLLDMYTKCSSLEEAKRMFDKMPEKDCVSWTTMIVGYARSGEFDAARCVFDMVPNRDIAAWNALISAYEQSGRPKEALSLFHELQVAATVKPDQLTLVSVLSACSQLGAMDLGGWIHIYIKKQGLKLNCHLTTSLIDMYSKCGDIDKALEVFRSMEQKDVYVWSAMIAGLAMHGCGGAAVDLFLQMQKAKVKPNAVTFTNLLCACSHAGLVEKGRLYFNQMLTVYGVAPEAKHYTCMVDILGRAGLLKEAVELIEKMPIAPATSVWGALLGACGIHGDVELAENACKHVLELEPRNHGAYVLMSNIYAKLGKWDAVSRLRKLMRNVGIKKEPGYSSVEINGVVHEFLVGDNSHPLSKKIYFKLAEIVSRLKSIGYVPNKDHLLQNVEEGVAKENALYLHSEKLAIAFGLISTDYPTPVRIVKNLRICGDCHSVAKLISQLYNREILLRDRYRFHHFKEGHCSCMDYW